MQPLPLASVMAPSAMQYSAGLRGPFTLFCPSDSWPTVPVTAPDADKWKQHGAQRSAIRALVPNTKAKTRTKDFIFGTGFCGMRLLHKKFRVECAGSWRSDSCGGGKPKTGNSDLTYSSRATRARKDARRRENGARHDCLCSFSIMPGRALVLWTSSTTVGGEPSGYGS
jgi:hypothetical protein